MNANKPPVRERDRLWYNTSDNRSDLPEESEPSSYSSIRDLIKSLECSNNSEFRRLAAEYLGQMGSTAGSAISALLLACVDGNETVRKTALNSLELIDPGWVQNSEVQKAFPKLTEIFKHSYCFKRSYSKEVSNAAYKLLNQIGEQAVSSLASLIVEEEDNIEYKIHAFWILRDMGKNAISAMPQLIQALNNKAAKVRVAAAEVLTTFRSDARVAIPDLTACLADQDIDVRNAIVACLIATESTVTDFRSLLEDSNSNVRKAVIDALVKIGPQVIPGLLPLLKDDNPHVHEAAINTLERISSAVPVLVEMVSQRYTNPRTDIDNFENHQEVIVAALHALGKIGSKASVAMSTIALAVIDPNSGIKLAAVQALGSINYNWVSDPIVVDAIAGFAGTEASVSKLIINLADPNVDVRKAAVACLAQFKVAAKPAVPHLLPLLEDKN
jgi:HEAT repeat protein